MSCSRPVSWEDLVAYWAHDLAAADVDRVDEHVMGCERCSAESARAFALAEAIRAVVPPFATREAVERLRSRGARIVENTFAPGQRQSVVFGRGVDFLIHRLAGLDLSNAQRVKITVRVESTGDLMLEDPNAPFDAREGVLVVCQRHFSAGFPKDVVFEVRAIEASGEEHTAVYPIPHVFED